MKKIKDYSIFSLWLSMIVVITMLCLLVAVVVQQNFRTSANDPQIALSEEIAHDLSSAPNQNSELTILNQLQESLSLRLVPGKTDIATSLLPFVVVYDQSGNPLASTAVLNSAAPILPKGVFDYTLSHGQDRLTWQPQNTLREAAVVTYFYSPVTHNAGYVLASRSLRDVEDREGTLSSIVFLLWFSSIIVLSFIILLL